MGDRAGSSPVIRTINHEPLKGGAISLLFDIPKHRRRADQVRHFKISSQDTIF